MGRTGLLPNLQPFCMYSCSKYIKIRSISVCFAPLLTYKNVSIVIILALSVSWFNNFCFLEMRENNGKCYVENARWCSTPILNQMNVEQAHRKSNKFCLPIATLLTRERRDATTRPILTRKRRVRYSRGNDASDTQEETTRQMSIVHPVHSGGIWKHLPTDCVASSSDASITWSPIRHSDSEGNGGRCVGICRCACDPQAQLAGLIYKQTGHVVLNLGTMLIVMSVVT